MRQERARILFFTISLGRGGAEMHLLRLLNQIDRTRFEVALALAESGGSYERELSPDIHVEHLQTGTLPSTTFRLLRSIGPLRSFVKRWKPDVVCSVMDAAGVVAARALSGLKPRPRLVHLVQIVPSVQYRERGGLMDRLLYTALPGLYRSADRVVALSEGVAGDVRRIAPGLNGSVEVIYNAGFDDNLIETASVPVAVPDAERPLIVACGRLSEQKGFRYLVDAMPLVRERVPATLWILGEGPDREALEARAAALGVADHVRLLGFQANPWQYMAAADLFVLSSLWEGFGNVLVEAMVTGTPVVSTACPHGPDEIIRDGEHGLLVPTADPRALADGIIRVLEDESLRRRIAENGRRRALDFHSSNIAREYDRLFAGLAGAR